MFKQISPPINFKLWFILFGLFFACTENEFSDASFQKQQSITDAKNYFELQKPDFSILKVTKAIKWENAIVVIDEKQTVVEVPLEVPKNIAISGTNPLANHFYRLLFLKAKNTTAWKSYAIFVSDNKNDSNLEETLYYNHIDQDFDGTILIVNQNSALVEKINYDSYKNKTLLPENTPTDFSTRDKYSNVAKITCILFGEYSGDGIFTPYYVVSCGDTGGGNGDRSPNYRSGGGGGGNEKPPVKDPCSKLKEQLANKAFKDQLDALKKNFDLKYETGFMQKADGTFFKAGVSSENQMVFSTDVNNIGYMHVHRNDYIDEEDLKQPIRIFSPADVKAFITLVANASRQGRALDAVYGGVTSSAGTYTLKFNGTFDLAKANSLVFDNAMLTKYKGYFKDGDVNIETVFLSFLQNEIGMSGISLYKSTETGTFEQKTLDTATGTVKVTPCN